MPHANGIGGQGAPSHSTMVLYTKLSLTFSTAEGNNTTIAIIHSTDPLKLMVRALKVWLGSWVGGQVLPFAEQGGLSQKVRSPLVSLHSVVVLSLLKLMMSYLVELHTGRLLKTLPHSEANHQQLCCQIFQLHISHSILLLLAG